MAEHTDQNLLHQVIYSVFVRNHTKEGTFRALEGDLDRLKGLGADIIWLMPIHPIGSEGRKGTLGSPYAIQDYRGINPEYGTREDFIHLVDAIHARGMKCIIDVVYNHTSPDSVLAHTHPEYFLRDAEGRPTRKVADWWDVVDLDYSNRDLWNYQIDTLKQWAAIVDGFRCDVASSVPLDFWCEARRQVETVRPGCIWLAESVHGAYVLGMRRTGAACATDTELYRAFDMTYDYDIWPFYEGFLKGDLSLRTYTDILNYQELTYPTGYIKARCLENHDTCRAASWFTSDRQLYSGMEYAPKKRVGLFDADDNYGDMRLDVQRYLTACKAMKQTLPLGGGFWWVTASDSVVLGHYEGLEGRALGVFDLQGRGGEVAVDLPDGVYENRLGGQVTVRNGRLPLGEYPVVI